MSGSRDIATQVHQLLRASILSGEYAAGEVLSQVELAAQYGVTRGPVREALRILEGEGLVVSEMNRRSRVASASISDLEQTYALAVAVESLIARVATPLLDQSALDKLMELQHRMDDPTIAIADWEVLHLELHEVIRTPAGARLIETADTLHFLGERYRRLYYSATDERDLSGIEHLSILEAIADRNADLAGERMAWHVGRTGTMMIGRLDPTHDPVMVRTALGWAAREGRPTPAAPDRRRPRNTATSLRGPRGQDARANPLQPEP